MIIAVIIKKKISLILLMPISVGPWTKNTLTYIEYIDTHTETYTHIPWLLSNEQQQSTEEIA